MAEIRSHLKIKGTKNMDELVLSQATITGLPRGLHEGTVLDLQKINYLFGANGSGKSLTLRLITRQAKEQIRQKGLNQKGYFSQYITATPQQSFYNDHFQILEKTATEFDLESDDITGGAFYQHLQEYPEILIKVRDALQKYLGRYPNVVRRGINNVMTFLREEEDVPAYSPQQESDGLKRLSLLLSYIYHPKCIFLSIDEPELFLHPDMASFLLQEVHEEVKFGKQFAFATHSPEMIQIGSGNLYSYLYFNLQDTLAKTHIVQASRVGANEIIEELGYLLDVNRRAFLFAPITLFVEGLADEVVYNELKHLRKVEWNRRIFMVNTGGASSMFNFWSLWKKFDKESRVLLDLPKQMDENDSVFNVINQFCDALGIDKSLPFDQKKLRLGEHQVFVAPYTDVLNFKDKTIEFKDVHGAMASGNLDVTDHTNTLNLAIAVPSTGRKQVRKEEEEWLKSIIQEVVAEATGVSDKSKALGNVVEKLKEQHPNLHIELSQASGEIMKIRFEVSRDRTLFIDISEKTLDSKYGAI